MTGSGGSGGTAITSGAGDFGVATSQCGSVLTGVVTKTNGVPFTSAATTAIGISGATIPLLNGANTWSGQQNMSGAGLTSQTVPVGSLATTGSASSTTYLSGTGAWGTPAGGSGYPNGSPPQFGGFSGTNTAEAETLSGDAAFTRAGANSYTIAVTKTGGVAFTSAATTAIGTSGATIPLLNGANTWSGVQTVTNSDWKLLRSSTGATTFTSANSGASNFTLTFPAATDTLVDLAGTQTLTNKSIAASQITTGTFGGTYTFTNGPTMSAANISATTLPVGSINATGTASSSTYLRGDGSWNTPSGSGTNPIYVHTLSAGTAATMVVNSSSQAGFDWDYESPTGAFTFTTLGTSGMTDGQQVELVVINSGTGNTVTWAPGSGITLKTIILGDSASTAGQVCTPPVTGKVWYLGQYKSAYSTFTLLSCGTDPPPASIGVGFGGLGRLRSLHQHSF